MDNIPSVKTQAALPGADDGSRTPDLSGAAGTVENPSNRHRHWTPSHNEPTPGTGTLNMEHGSRARVEAPLTD
ncbi:hypothetical protein CCMA1212_003108 [Trichoderma ghanense]|uniref:Uncharacterized protein n=1 Tax=Trichoderma ghanense TaxID=65468 RepID=A0ABY2HBY2_9HYPO